MQETKQTIALQFTKEDSYLKLEISKNFNTENPIFEELAFYLGVLERHNQKDGAFINLTTLEKDRCFVRKLEKCT